MSAALDALKARRRAPLSTYRLQLHKDFGFRDAAAVADYLTLLGVTDVYTSPILKARPGSPHGYDITDHGVLNPELGGDAGFEELSSALAARGLGWLLDFVPNHMGADAASNPWWRDVLENGPSSERADYFDIDWNPEKAELSNKVLLPVLGDQYGAVLESGGLKLAYADGRFSVTGPGLDLPVDPQQAPQVLGWELEGLKEQLKDDPALPEYLSVLTQLEKLPPRSSVDADKAAERRRESGVARARLAQLVESSPAVRRRVDAALAAFNGRPGEPGSFDALHRLLESQAYRLAYWKTAGDEINYRRFFDVNDLAGVRMERDDVFEAAHRLVLRLLSEGKVTGLRIDHPDGLFDPSAYFERLQAAFLRAWAERRGGAEAAAELEAWRAEELRRDFKGLGARPLYVAAEKILTAGEELDPHWRVDGTTGYDFLNDAGRVFVDARGASALRGIHERFTDRRSSLETVVYDGKKLIMSASMAAELNVLSELLNRISEGGRRTRDFTRHSLRGALREIVACFPVYRTYVTGLRATAFDRDAIALAVARARRRNPAVEPSIFEFIRDLMMPGETVGLAEPALRERLKFAMKLQQYTGPVQAKGLEDTAFYRRHVLVSANEVGSDPDRLSSTPAEFHESNLRRAAEWPRTMLATATHDTKRGEDARARAAVLSEIPEEWEEAVRGWAALNRPPASDAAGSAPDSSDEYLFYQTMLGCWDFSRPDSGGLEELERRLGAYMLKAAREAKERTSWIAPDDGYEKALLGFVGRALSNRAFLAAFEGFARRVAAAGAVHSLSRTLLKAFSPGVADFYQGTELWDLSLVDPDNRRPVDYAARKEALAALEPLLAAEDAGAGARELLEHWEDGRVKLYATAKVLRFRRARSDLFGRGDYAPLPVRGGDERFLAFRRSLGAEQAVVVVPRLCGRAVIKEGLACLEGLGHGAAVELPHAACAGLTDIFTGATLPGDGTLDGALGRLPFAVFASRS